MKFLTSLCAAAIFATPVMAYDDDVKGFVSSNILGVFYHELGHALIDLEGIPIFGQEEDAADVLSVFLIDAFYDEDAAVALAYDTAFGFLSDAESNGENPSYWGVHGPDEQRYYNLVCLFYGANPDEREDVAEELGLPEERAETCPEEYDQAANAWGSVLDEIVDEDGGDTFNLIVPEEPSEDAQVILDVLVDEVAAWNADFELSGTLDIMIEECGEANAFYSPDDKAVTMCIEFVPYLAEQYQNLDL